MYLSLYRPTYHSVGQRWGFVSHLSKGFSQGVGLLTIAQLQLNTHVCSTLRN